MRKFNEWSCRFACTIRMSYKKSLYSGVKYIMFDVNYIFTYIMWYSLVLETLQTSPESSDNETLWVIYF